MGARAQIKVEQNGGDAPVYLYTHWGAGCVVQATRKALEVGVSRYTDPGYFTRIAFDQLKPADADPLLSYGIDTSEHCDLDVLVTVDGLNDAIAVYPSDSKQEPLFRGTREQFLEWSKDGKEIY